jgi:hypothetical protein
VAASAALGVIAGQAVVIGFCLGYGHLAARVAPLWALAGALGVGAAGGLAAAAIRPGWLAAAVAMTVVVVGLLTWPPRPSTVESVAPEEPSPARVAAQTAARMAVVGGLVATLAATAKIVGPFAAGILSSSPIILSVVVPATHRGAGPLAAADLVRGTLVGLPGAVAFTTVVAYTVDSLGPLPGAAAAIAVLLVINLLPWRRVTTLRRPRPGRARPARVESGDPVGVGGGDPGLV